MKVIRRKRNDDPNLIDEYDERRLYDKVRTIANDDYLSPLHIPCWITIL